MTRALMSLSCVVIFDVFKRHMCDSVHTLFESNRILQVHVPNNCTDLFQPLDQSVNRTNYGAGLASSTPKKSASN